MAILNFFPEGDSATDIGDATITLASSSFTYDGTEKTKGITSVTCKGKTLTENTDYVVVPGTNKGINAGEYRLTIAGVGKYVGTKGASWSIAKANGSVSASPSTVSIVGASGTTGTVSLTVVGDGVITAESADSTKATATVSGNNVIITGVSEGSTTVTVTMAAGTNYKGASCTISVSVTEIYPVLADNTPDKIKKAVELGIEQTLWSVGDVTSEISIGSYGLTDNSTMPATTARAFILEFNHTDQGGTQSGITFQFGKIGNPPDCTDVAFYSSGGFRMQAGDNWGPGWSGSRIRTIVIPNFINALPQEWQNVLSDTTISCRVGETWGTVTDKVFLLSVYEVQGHVEYQAGNNESDPSETVHTQYAYYQNGNSKVKYQHSSTSTTCPWWTRTRWHTGNGVKYFWCGIGRTGYCQAFYCWSDTEPAFAPAFRISA